MLAVGNPGCSALQASIELKYLCSARPISQMVNPDLVGAERHRSSDTRGIGYLQQVSMERRMDHKLSALLKS